LWKKDEAFEPSHDTTTSTEAEVASSFASAQIYIKIIWFL
jgi:hypothetical protein